jgi:ribosome-associated protein
MSRDYITKEFNTILNDKTFEAPLNTAMAAAWVMGNFKGINLKILDLREVSSIADYFVLGSASNPIQANAMAEEISTQMRLNCTEALSREGLKYSTDWILLDYGDIIIHVFTEAARNVYDLDHLYKTAIPVEIPSNFYFENPSGEINPVGDDKDYF